MHRNVFVGLKLWELPGGNLKLAPYKEDRDKPKKEPEHSRLIGSKFYKLWNLHTMLVLGGHKRIKSLHPPASISKVCIEALTGFRHIYLPDGLSNTLLS